VSLRVADRDLRAAEFLDHAAEHELNQIRAVLVRYARGNEGTERWDITAPVSGVVLRVLQESETSIQSGAAVMEIGDPRDIEIVADVLSTDAVEIRPGADVIVERWGGVGTLTGRVRRVEPAAFTKISTLGVEEQRVNVLIDLLPTAEQRGLGDAYQLDVRITVFAKDDAIILPAGALFRRGENWNVFVVSDGRSQVRKVELLRRSGRTAAVTSGVAPGEQVIVYPGDQVADGVAVTAR
jgi:HlyD family secretion protein